MGWALVGDAPLRKKGYGTLPLPGWDPNGGWWDATVPFEQMPWCVDPVAAFVATANNQPVLDGNHPFLGADWLDGYRQATHRTRSRPRRDWDVADAMRLQIDRLVCAVAPFG